MRRLISFITAILTVLSAHASIVVGDTSHPPYIIEPEASTGLERIYVLYDASGVTLSYRPDNGMTTENITWSRFSTLGGGYAEPIASSVIDGLPTITLSGEDMGYIVTVEGRQHCIWVINYANHICVLNSASVNLDESDCTTAAIDIAGAAPRISFYTVNGIPRELPRDITIEYSTLKWDDEASNYSQETVTTSLASLSAITRVNAPLCDTRFDISGDRFLRFWEQEERVETDYFTATAVEAHTSASQTEREVDNEISDGSSDLGGSAPAEIIFRATPTDAVEFREWQFSRFADFDIIDLRFNQDDVTYTFRDNGTTYVRYMAANATGDCEWISETYSIDIGESKLLCPNAFSPGASEGVNDEWKVSYKSIIEFECHIFNRWGIELFSTTNPATGWDGKYKGKTVPAGVYFYVIKAKGADGKDYSLSGDINIINYNQNTPYQPSE